MKRWNGLVLLAVAALLCGGAAAEAQTGAAGSPSDPGEEYYLDEEIDEHGERVSLAVGFGLVEIGDNTFGNATPVGNTDDVEPYYTLSLRFAFGDRDAHRGPGNQGFRGYLEPELGYWETSNPVGSSSDLLLGLNIIGALPVNAVEMFVGGGLGIHFLDGTVNSGGINVDQSDEALGANAQFGIDVAITERVSVFGVGRFDLVDDDRDELEGKAFIGFRLRFRGDRNN